MQGLSGAIRGSGASEEGRAEQTAHNVKSYKSKPQIILGSIEVLSGQTKLKEEKHEI